MNDIVYTLVKTKENLHVSKIYENLASFKLNCLIQYISKCGDVLNKRTHEEYVKELKFKNPNVEVVEKYINSTTKIKHFCLIHKVYWYTTPTRALNGSGCEICHNEKISKRKTKTNEEYFEYLKNNNPDIVPLEPYISMKTKILHLCKKHNIEWYVSPDNILHGHGCRLCGNEKISNNCKITYDDYVKRLKEINSNIVCTGNYINSTTHAKHRCLIDGYEWDAVPSSILSGRGCPKCGGTLKKTNDVFVKEVNKINRNIDVIGIYTTARTKIMFKCKKCGNAWNAYPYSILEGTGCPKCNESHGEKEVQNWLDKHNISYVRQMKFDKCIDIALLPFDFYLPNNNICIEYDGKQHFSPVDLYGGKQGFIIRKKHDDIKNKFCEENNINLIRIPYYKNVETELNNSIYIS